MTTVQKSSQQSSDEPLVVVVDDDESIREGLSDLLRTVGLEVRVFGSTPELLDAALPDRPTCLVLDVRLPGPSGLDLQNSLAERGSALPIIFMTGHGDIPMTVRAMKAGASDFLSKPFRDQDMLDAITAAISRDRTRRKERAALDGLVAREASLTTREREVMAGVVRGLMNKQIAGELGISEVTVKLHRGSVMRKMEARSVAELVRMSELITKG